MSTKVEKRIVVEVPVSTAYTQWTRFEDFPRFMRGVDSVTRLGDERLRWVAHIAGARREWEARITEQAADRRVAWTSTEGPANSGAVEFKDLGGNRTELALTLEYQPVRLVEKVGELVHMVGRQAEHDLKDFKEFVERQGAVQQSGEGARTGEPVAGETPYSRFSHPFDQTGGLVDFEGESDETVDGENYSSGERRQRRHDDGPIPPYGGTLGQH